MTPEEIVRFAQMLAEADRVRARIAEDESAESHDDPPFYEVRLEPAA